MTADASVVLYTRTDASDFRPFLNFGPMPVASNFRAFDEISRIVDEAYSAPDNVRVVLFVGGGCVCGIAGQPPVRDYIKGRRNIAFIGLYFDDVSEAVMPTGDVLWSLYDEVVSDIWETPSSMIGGPGTLSVSVPGPDPRFEGWLEDSIHRRRRDDRQDVLALTCSESGPEPDRTVGFDSFVFTAWRKGKVRDDVHYPDHDPKHEVIDPPTDNGGVDITCDGANQSGTSDSVPLSDITSPCVKTVFGDLEMVDLGIQSDSHIRVFRSNDREILVISSDEDISNSRRSRGFRSAIMKSLGLGDSTLEALIKAASRIGEQVESEMIVDPSDHHRTYVLYPVQSSDSAVEKARDVLRSYDLPKYGVDAVIMCDAEVQTDGGHGRCLVFHQRDPKDIRSDVLCDWAEYVAVPRPASLSVHSVPLRSHRS